MLSTAPQATRAVLFVHGFGGHPFKTWFQTHELISSDPRWEDADVFFVGYDSIRDEIALSAAYLARVIKTLTPNPPREIFVNSHLGLDSELRVGQTTYETVELIGHSLGAVIIRAAILNLLRSAPVDRQTGEFIAEYTHYGNATLRLFAPAHGGARVSGLVGAARRTLGFRAMIDLATGWSPAMQELDASSNFLSSLREDTNHFAEKMPTVEAFRASILWAQRDEVVSALPYRYDAQDTLLNASHTSVCKPRRTYGEGPFEFMSGSQLTAQDGVI